MPDHDVIVVGGGPAGAVSALKCSESGLNVLLVERGRIGRHKPCGGILPHVCADLMSESLGANLPRDVMCSPETLGLYYVPPSGRRNSGSLKNYRLLNINRDLFDQWLRRLAAESGVRIWYETVFLEFRESDSIQVLVKSGSGSFIATTRYLIGADGVYSKVRDQLYRGARVDVMPVLQEYWRAEGDFKDYFYAFFREEISSNYGYVIPKDDLYVVGLGIPKTSCTATETRMESFKCWLREEFAFKPKSLVKREAWAIPYGFTFEGVKNVILAGDAGGFCNALSGEGVRLAIESGVAASNAIQDAISHNRPLTQAYDDHVEGISSFVYRVHKFAASLTDKSREEFVQSELAHIPFG